jgi:hypothetical protein
MSYPKGVCYILTEKIIQTLKRKAMSNLDIAAQNIVKELETFTDEGKKIILKNVQAQIERRIIGYRLINTYPYSPKLGYFQPKDSILNMSTFKDYPYNWEEVYSK